MKPIVINTLQLRLAIELASQHAAHLEIKKQVEEQMPGREINIEGAAINITKMDWPSFKVNGKEVVWE